MRRVNSFVERQGCAEPKTEEQEAQAILLALAGHNCQVCGVGLTRVSGYFCCGLAYCPLCGGIAEGPEGCGHRVARKYRQLTLLDHAGAPLRLLSSPAVTRSPLVYQCAELAGQLVLELDVASPPPAEVSPLHPLSQLSKKALKQHLLDMCLIPDVRTAYQDTNGRYIYHFFSREPVTGRSRAQHAAAQIRRKQNDDGTRRD